MAEGAGPRFLDCGARRLSLHTPRIMGVLNITPDSFSDGGRHLTGGAPDLHRIREEACAMLEEGVAILDIGGESTRPGARPVSVEEELRRVIPVVECLADLDTIISVDTGKAAVAEAAIGAGAHMINDVGGLRHSEMMGVIAGSTAGVCVMHMLGEPRTMQQSPEYEDVVGEVGSSLGCRVAAARAAGIGLDRIAVDPGFGFGKTLEHNLELLRKLEGVRCHDRPIVAGLSRKSMIGTLTGRPVDERVHGSVAAALLAVERGADILRVHDVAATADALKILEAVGT
jgi:dihydropteroate synthase